MTAESRPASGASWVPTDEFVTESNYAETVMSTHGTSDPRTQPIETEAAQVAVELRGPHAREAIRVVNADMRAMERIADEWSQLSVAGRKFMLSALSAGTTDA